jgi:phosphohistidine phosphatase
MRVYLVRHGQAVAPQVDSSLPLSDEGRNDIEHVARTLVNMNVKLSSIYHSGKLRAEETAMILAAALGTDDAIQTTGLAPNDNPAEALEFIEASEEDIMLVGHLPLMDRLLRALVKPGRDDELPEFGTGTLVAVEPAEDGWQIFRALGPHMIW